MGIDLTYQATNEFHLTFILLAFLLGLNAWLSHLVYKRKSEMQKPKEQQKFEACQVRKSQSDGKSIGQIPPSIVKRIQSEPTSSQVVKDDGKKGYEDAEIGQRDNEIQGEKVSHKSDENEFSVNR